MNAKHWQKTTFPLFSDPKGQTIPVEFKDLPFKPERMYFVTGNKGFIRGGHAHLVEEEVFFCISGSVTAKLVDAKGEQEVILDQKEEGLYVPTLCWHEFYNFSPNAVLLAVSSTPFLPGEGNYIMDFEVFIEKYCK